MRFKAYIAIQYFVVLGFLFFSVQCRWVLLTRGSELKNQSCISEAMEQRGLVVYNHAIKKQQRQWIKKWEKRMTCGCGVGCKDMDQDVNRGFLLMKMKLCFYDVVSEMTLSLSRKMNIWGDICQFVDHVLNNTLNKWSVEHVDGNRGFYTSFLAIWCKKIGN